MQSLDDRQFKSFADLNDNKWARKVVPSGGTTINPLAKFVEATYSNSDMTVTYKYYESSSKATLYNTITTIYTEAQDTTFTSSVSFKSFLSGVYYDQNSNGDCYDQFTTLLVSGGYLFSSRFIVEQTVTFDRLATEVTVGGAGKLMRLGIYADDGADRPGALVLDGGELDCTATGAKELTINQQLTPGIYWLTMITNGNITCRAHFIVEGGSLGYASATSVTKSYMVYVAYAYALGNLPVTHPAAAFITTAVPRILLRAA